jgi:hypothetical protein
MKMQITRRELTWVAGGVVWMTSYFGLRYWAVDFWYAVGIGAIIGAIAVVAIAALIDESK